MITDQEKRQTNYWTILINGPSNQPLCKAALILCPHLNEKIQIYYSIWLVNLWHPIPTRHWHLKLLYNLCITSLPGDMLTLFILLYIHVLCCIVNMFVILFIGLHFERKGLCKFVDVYKSMEFLKVSMLMKQGFEVTSHFQGCHWDCSKK